MPLDGDARAMPRSLRLDPAGVPQHVLQRGNNRAACFFGDVDRRFYLKCLSESAALRGCRIHAYVLMTNHVHLLVTPDKPRAIGAMMQDIGRKYVRILNALYGRTGTLWEGRFKSSLIDSERYLLTCHRYIEQNPVRAGMVSSAAEFPWSSHQHYLGNGKAGFLTPHLLFHGLGTDLDSRRAAFRELFEVRVDEKSLSRIRAAISAGCPISQDPPARGRPNGGRAGPPPSIPESGKLF